MEDALQEILGRASAVLATGGGGSGGAVLLHGPPGCGKSLLIAQAGEQLRPAPCVRLGLEVLHSRPGGTEAALHQQLETASAAAPCLLVIDEVHALAPATASPGTMEHRLVLQLAEGVQALRGTRVFVLAACRALGDVHPVLRRSGRLHHSIAIHSPSPTQRLDILQTLTARLRPSDVEAQAAFDEHLDVVAAEAHGLCGAQLVGVCQQAAMAAWRREASKVPEALVVADSGAEQPMEADAVGATVRGTDRRAMSGKVDGARVECALPTEVEWRAALESAREVNLGALRLASSAASTVAPTMSSDEASATLHALPAGKQLIASVAVPLRSPDAYSRLGVAPPRGVLLHGPSGCGKTTLARALAVVARANFVEVQAPQLLSPLVGESEARLGAMFGAARDAAPCILFIDQLEVLAPPRGADSSAEGTLDRLLSLLLVELDGVQAATGPPVILLGACASPTQLDPAILRPGRLDVHVLLHPPDEPQRLALLGRMFRNSPVDESQVSFSELAARTAGFSLAQLSALCREAAMSALREDLQCAAIGSRHIHSAMATALKT